MRVSCQAYLLVVGLSLKSLYAFSPSNPPRQAPSIKSRVHVRAAINGETNGESTASTKNRLDKYLQQAQLRQAVQYLQEHPETELTRERWNHIFTAIEERTANAEENTVNLRQLMEFPRESAARQEMTDMYQTLAQQNQLTLYGAVNIHDPPAAGSHTVPPALLEQILDLPMKALTPQPTNSLLVAGVVAAIVEGLVSTATGIPLNTIFLLTLVVAFFDRLFLNGAVFESFLKLFTPGVQSKILRHEAGHFLAAYLLGCPVEGIVLSAWAALQDRRFGGRQVSAGTSFYDPELSRQINSGGQKLTRASIDRYSIIVMAGIAAEADLYGRADGGAGDEMALVAFLSQLNSNSKSSVWNSDSIRNQARWGALQAVLLMREYKPAYDALVDALERGGRLGDCIFAIEKAARDHDLKPLQPKGYLVDEATGTTTTWQTQKPQALEPKVSTTTASSSSEPLNEEEPLATLKEYKATVVQRLQEIDEKLKEIGD